MRAAGSWRLGVFLLAGGMAIPLAHGADGDAQVHVAGQVSSTFSDVAGGDRGRYREDRQIRDGFSGGLDWLTLDARQGAWRLDSEVRARNEVDLELSNHLQRDGWGYVKQEATVYPHYYDASNRFYDTAPRVYDLDTTLRTLRGDVSLEAGTAVEGWPRTFLGYRHRVRDGETNSYWGAWLRDSTSNNDFITFVQPIERVRDERSNTLYFGATHQLAGWALSARQDITRFEGVDTYSEPGYYNNGAFQFTRYYRNVPRHTTWTTTMASARDALEGKLRLGLDWRFSSTQTDSTTDVDSIAAAGTRHISEHSLNYNVAEHAGRKHSQATGLRLDYAPWDWARLWAGSTFLTGRAVGTSMRGEEGSEATASTVDNNAATVEEWWASKTIDREIGWTEELGVELTVLPKTRAAFNVVLDQNRVKYDWASDVSDSVGRNSGNEGDWSWLSTWWEDRNSYTTSIRTWAIPHLNLLGRYRYRTDTADVDDQVDVANGKPGDGEYDAGIATGFYYPGRIEDTRRGTHEFLVAPTVRLGPKLTATPRFQHRTTHYEVSGEPEPEISSFRANTVAVGVLAQPVERMACSVDVSRQFALTWTRATSFTNTLNTDPDTGAASARWYGGLTPEFDASYTAVNSDVSYTWQDVTVSVLGGIVDGNGDFDTTLVSTGLGLQGPLGALEGARWKSAYRFYDYHEDENNGINDYTAHVVMFTLSQRF